MMSCVFVSFLLLWWNTLNTKTQNEKSLGDGRAWEKLRQKLKAGTYKQGWLADQCSIISNQGAHTSSSQRSTAGNHRGWCLTATMQAHAQLSHTSQDHLPWEWCHPQCAGPYYLSLQSRQSPTAVCTDWSVIWATLQLRLTLRWV